MRRLLALTVGLFLLGPTAARAQGVVLNPQLGVSGSWLTSDPQQTKDKARLGYQVGGFVRLGSGRAYAQPGVFFQQTTLKLIDTGTASPTRVESNLAVKSVHLPLLAGVQLVSSPALGLRAALGPSATIVTGVASNDWGIVKDDYRSVTWGAVVGIGADVTTITLDASYELGLSKVFDTAKPGFATADSKQNVARLSAGLKF
jgi:hypothetical protein